HQATTSNLSQYLRGLNLGLLVINPYFRSRFPQASLWFATNTKPVSSTHLTLPTTAYFLLSFFPLSLPSNYTLSSLPFFLFSFIF
ncbi:hypothetical protein, partial [Mesomycoplasma hyorhinis]|uniref:hypothetical protein n=1 Tax=Mesomycoplasma hyorhinis TaxID=2100 RepID=UPI001C0481FA